MFHTVTVTDRCVHCRLRLQAIDLLFMQRTQINNNKICVHIQYLGHTGKRTTICHGHRLSRIKTVSTYDAWTPVTTVHAMRRTQNIKNKNCVHIRGQGTLYRPAGYNGHRSFKKIYVHIRNQHHDGVHRKHQLTLTPVGRHTQTYGKSDAITSHPFDGTNHREGQIRTDTHQHPLHRPTTEQ